MTPCRPPAALRFLRLAVPRMHSLISLPGGRVRHQGLELVTRYLQPGIRRGANRVLPSSWGTPIVRLHMFLPTPAGLLVPDRCSAAAWPLVIVRQRLPRKVFRRSIAWLSDWLSTLRSAGYPNTTQDSLPAAGQALPDGLSTRKVPTKGFRSASLHPILLSQTLLGANDVTDAVFDVNKQSRWGGNVSSTTASGWRESNLAAAKCILLRNLAMA
jgi:hypothetical protein